MTTFLISVMFDCEFLNFLTDICHEIKGFQLQVGKGGKVPIIRQIHAGAIRCVRFYGKIKFVDYLSLPTHKPYTILH